MGQLDVIYQDLHRPPLSLHPMKTALHNSKLVFPLGACMPELVLKLLYPVPVVSLLVRVHCQREKLLVLDELAAQAQQLVQHTSKGPNNRLRGRFMTCWIRVVIGSKCSTPWSALEVDQRIEFSPLPFKDGDGGGVEVSEFEWYG